MHHTAATATATALGRRVGARVVVASALLLARGTGVARRLVVVAQLLGPLLELRELLVHRQQLGLLCPAGIDQVQVQVQGHDP